MRGPVAVLVVAVVVVVGGCSGPGAKAPAPPPPARPIAGLADLEGTWRATDLDGWTFELELRGGEFVQTIRRTTLGPCVQKGKAQAFQEVYGQPFDPSQYGGATYGTPTDGTVFAFVVSLAENACNPDYRGAQLITLASEYHGDDVTIRTGVGTGGAEETRRYERVVGSASSRPR